MTALAQKTKAMITQSNYIPWKGYFDNIAAVDYFVVYDEMQFTKRDWRNRNLIVTPTGVKWLTIPVEVSGKQFQKIKDTRVADKSWPNSHWLQLKQFYRKAPCFAEMADWIEPLYRNCKFEFLTDINLHFIRNINQFLNIATQIVSSSDFDLSSDKNRRLVNMCQHLGITEYYTGPAAKNYLDLSCFESKNITVNYFNYDSYTSYQQLNDEFTHGVTILDLIFNTGNNAAFFMKNMSK